VMTVGVQKLRGAPTNCFIAGTLVAVAGVNAGTGTADAGPSSASKPIEEIQVGDFVWARAEHDPSAPAVLQKVVALYRNTAHDLQQLEVVGDQGSAEPLGQSVQIVATDEHPFYVVDVGWTTADAVQVGKKLVGAGGAVLMVVANRDWKPDSGVVVYNFQVEGDHTYFVGDIHAQGEWVWTHNACTFDGFNGKLTREGSDQLRDNARNIWQQLTGRRPIWDDLEVHHRVPLEWSHILPKADPNRVANLVGVNGKTHKQVTGLWGEWKRSLRGREPSQSEVIKHALSIDSQFANHWVFPR
jgi:Pretoxin HINT domain